MDIDRALIYAAIGLAAIFLVIILSRGAQQLESAEALVTRLEDIKHRGEPLSERDIHRLSQADCLPMSADLRIRANRLFDYADFYGVVG